MASTRVIKVTTQDDRKFDLEHNICKQSRRLNSIFAQNKKEIKLDDISSSTFERIIAYLVYHTESDDTVSWDDQFIRKFTGIELVNLIWAANYLVIPTLLDLGKKRMIDVIDNNDVPTMRNILNVKADFTAEEEGIISQAMNWQ